jgi:hypothetical protein
LPAFVREHFDSIAYANKVGWLYVARADHQGEAVFKVGFSADPAKRLIDLRSLKRFSGCVLIAQAEARMVDEMGFHQCMSKHRVSEVHKEWYRHTSMASHLADHINEHGAIPAELIALGDGIAAGLIANRLAKAGKVALNSFLRERAKDA